MCVEGLPCTLPRTELDHIFQVCRVFRSCLLSEWVTRGSALATPRPCVTTNMSNILSGDLTETAAHCRSTLVVQSSLKQKRGRGSAVFLLTSYTYCGERLLSGSLVFCRVSSLSGTMNLKKKKKNQITLACH